jgi:hypothetical protein
VLPSPSAPELLSPHAQSEPSARRAKVRPRPPPGDDPVEGSGPAAANDGERALHPEASPAAGPHCPKPFPPQVRTVPSPSGPRCGGTGGDRRHARQGGERARFARVEDRPGGRSVSAITRVRREIVLLIVPQLVGTIHPMTRPCHRSAGEVVIGSGGDGSDPAEEVDAVEPLTCTAVTRSVVVPSPSSPSALLPQAQTVPSLRSARVCNPPPATPDLWGA